MISRTQPQTMSSIHNLTGTEPDSHVESPYEIGVDQSFRAFGVRQLGEGYLAVRDRQGELIAKLVPLLCADTENDHLIESFTRWRTVHMTSFSTQFDASTERTRDWLVSRVLSDERKIFLKIYTANDRLVGHLAAIDRHDYLEYDNLIRGEPVETPRFVYYVEMAFMRWLFSISTAEFVFGLCLEDNVRVLRLHERTGFSRTRRVPVAQVQIDGAVAWRPLADGAAATQHNIEIKLFRNDCTQLYSDEIGCPDVDADSSSE